MADILEQLYAQASGRLGAYGYVLTGSQAAGEDLLHDAIVKVFVKRRRLENVRMAESYVRTTMARLYIDRLRRDATWRRLAPAQAALEARVDDIEAVLAADVATRVLAQLPPRVRAAVVLRYLDGLSVAEIAHAMRISDGAVKRYLSDGRALLGPALGVADATEAGDADVAEVRVAVVERGRS